MKSSDKCWMCVLLIFAVFEVVVNFSIGDTYAVSYCTDGGDNEDMCNTRSNMCYWCFDACLPILPCSNANGTTLSCNGAAFQPVHESITCQQYQNGYSGYVAMMIILGLGSVTNIVFLSVGVFYTRPLFSNANTFRNVSTMFSFVSGIVLVLLCTVITDQYTSAIPPGVDQIWPVVVYGLTLIITILGILFILIRALVSHFSQIRNGGARLRIPLAVSLLMFSMAIYLSSVAQYVNGWLLITSILHSFDFIYGALSAIVNERKPDTKPMIIHGLGTLLFLIVACGISGVTQGATRNLWATSVTFYSIYATIRLRNDEMEALRNATTAAQFENSLPVPEEGQEMETGTLNTPPPSTGNEYPGTDNGIDHSDDDDDSGFGIDLQFVLVVLLSVCFAIMVFLPEESWLEQVGLTSILAFLAISMLIYGSMRRGDGSLFLMSLKAAINHRRGFEQLE